MPRVMALVLVTATLWITGCATVSVDHPNNWLTRDGRYIANSEAYLTCLRESRHIVTESDSSIGAGTYGGGKGALYGSSESRQVPRTDATMLTACMASKGYRLRTPDEMTRQVPFESSGRAGIDTPPNAAPHEPQRGAWTMEVRPNYTGEGLVWVGGWTPKATSGSCETQRRQLLDAKGDILTVAPCRFEVVTNEPSGIEVWMSESSEAFVAAPRRPDCDKAAASIAASTARKTTGFSLPPCQRAWLRRP